MHILRPYQNSASDGVIKQWESVQATMGVAATGSGKTSIFCDIIRRTQPARALILAHRTELVTQAVERLREFGLDAEIEKADLVAGNTLWNRSPVVVATPQTLYGNKFSRLQRFKPEDFGVVICDEAHHYVSDSYAKVVKHFKQNPNMKLLGVSVGPQSQVVLRGGAFSTGFIGTIEVAFTLAASKLTSYPWRGFDRIDLDGVESRGWLGKAFGWKECFTILRHAHEKPCSSLSFGGLQSVTTNDHSVYRVRRGSSVRVKNNTCYRPELDCVESNLLRAGDTLVGDDGGAWDGESLETPIDVCKLISPLTPKLRIGCNVKSLPRGLFRDYSSQQIHAWRNSGSLPLDQFARAEPFAPIFDLRTEGSRSKIAPHFYLSDWAYFLGFYLGDGWVCGDADNRRIGFAVGQDQVSDFEDVLKALPHTIWSSITKKQMPGKSMEFRCSNILLANLLLAIFGEIKCYGKFIPAEWICTWPKNARLSLLRGLLDSDGCDMESKNKKRQVFVTTSYSLARSIMMLAVSLGFKPSIHQRNPQPGGVVNGRQITGKRISWSVGWSPQTKESGNHYGKRTKYVHDRMVFDERTLRENIACDSPNYVYDLEMDGHPSFVSDGILVHNTATPDRTDNEALSQLFDTVAFDIEIQDLIQWGYLVDIVGATPKIESLDYSGCRMVSGDLNGRDLADVMEKDKTLLGIADATLKTVGDKRSLVFAVTVKQAERYAQIFNDYKPHSADCVFGHTPDDARVEIFQRFQSGHLQILVNVGVATEGYDNPNIECVVMARPTLSRSLFAQMIGRGTRPLKGVIHEGIESDEARRAAIAYSAKPSLLVLDFAGNSGRHSLVTVADILGGRVSEEARTLAKKRLAEKSGGKILDELALAEIELKKKAEEERKRGLTPTAKFQIHYVDLFDGFKKRAEKWKSFQQKYPLTEKQRKILTTNGHNPDLLTPAQGQSIITKIFAAYDWQKSALLKAGYAPADVNVLRKWEAQKLLNELKQNGSRKPASAPAKAAEPDPSPEPRQIEEESPFLK